MEQFGANERPCYIDSIQKGIPPPIGGATRALYPHNFSHQKYSKKSACLMLEKFSEIFSGGNVSGERKVPNLVERGRGGAKI